MISINLETTLTPCRDAVISMIIERKNHGLAVQFLRIVLTALTAHPPVPCCATAMQANFR